MIVRLCRFPVDASLGELREKLIGLLLLLQVLIEELLSFSHA
jgi:hypothetical protein